MAQIESLESAQLEQLHGNGGQQVVAQLHMGQLRVGHPEGWDRDEGGPCHNEVIGIACLAAQLGKKVECGMGVVVGGARDGRHDQGWVHAVKIVRHFTQSIDTGRGLGGGVWLLEGVLETGHGVNGEVSRLDLRDCSGQQFQHLDTPLTARNSHQLQKKKTHMQI